MSGLRSRWRTPSRTSSGIRRGGWRARGRSDSSAWYRSGDGAVRSCARVPGRDRVRRQRDPSLPLLPAVRRVVVPALRPAGDTGAAAALRRHRRAGSPGALTRRSRVAMAVFALVAGAHCVPVHRRPATCWERATAKSVTPKPRCTSTSALPPDAVIITMQHSGSIRYYTGRMIVRWDALESRAWLDRAVAFLRDRGVATYALLEYWEEAEFRQRFTRPAAARRARSRSRRDRAGGGDRASIR